MNLRRRCAKGRKICREFQPCPKHPTSNWANNKSRPVPNNQKTLKKRVADDRGASCARCGSRKSPELDHIIPRSHGGTDDLTNLQLLCPPCHRKKTDDDKRRYR